MVVRLLVSLVIGYLFGSVSGSIVTSKLFFKSDIRQHGSGNAGMTNSLRVYGVGAAVSTTLIDALKSVAAMVIAGQIGGADAMIAAGAGVMLGHAYPLYFGFRGGKCVVCIAVVGSFISWQTVLIAIAMFAIIVFTTKIVSASSCGAMLTAMLAAVILGVETKQLIFIIAACSFVIFLHRGNIKRIINGTEKKIKPKGGQQK